LEIETTLPSGKSPSHKFTTSATTSPDGEMLTFQNVNCSVVNAAGKISFLPVKIAFRQQHLMEVNLKPS